MLSNTEHLFVRLLRGTIVATAAAAIAVAVMALAYAAYAKFAPEPQAKLSWRIDKLRQQVDPAILLKQVFPESSNVAVAASSPDGVVYQTKRASDDEIIDTFNKFLDIAYNARFDDRQKYKDWLYGNNKIPFFFNAAIDDTEARNENNVQILWRSLMNDYAARLVARAQTLETARRQRMHTTSFDKLAAPTGAAQAPYFLVWFFERLGEELTTANRELIQQRIERNVLRATIPLSLSVAAAAFGYFLVVMFLFLMVSIEASVRHLATLAVPKDASPPAPPNASSPSLPSDPVASTS